MNAKKYVHQVAHIESLLLHHNSHYAKMPMSSIRKLFTISRNSEAIASASASSFKAPKLELISLTVVGTFNIMTISVCALRSLQAQRHSIVRIKSRQGVMRCEA